MHRGSGVPVGLGNSVAGIGQPALWRAYSTVATWHTQPNAQAGGCLAGKAGRADLAFDATFAEAAGTRMASYEPSADVRLDVEFSE